MPSGAIQDPEPCQLQNLSQASVGCDLMIRSLEGPGCEQLRSLGFCETLRVRKLSDGRNLICSVCGTRLAVSQELAEQVKVTPMLSA